MDVISPSSLATANAHQPLARKVALVLFAVFLVLPFVVALFSGGPFLEAIDWIWVGVTVLAAGVRHFNEDSPADFGTVRRVVSRAGSWRLGQCVSLLNCRFYVLEIDDK